MRSVPNSVGGWGPFVWVVRLDVKKVRTFKELVCTDFVQIVRNEDAYK